MITPACLMHADTRFARGRDTRKPLGPHAPRSSVLSSPTQIGLPGIPAGQTAAGGIVPPLFTA